MTSTEPWYRLYCENCGSKALSVRCELCKGANYCSKKCATKHYKKHKSMCNANQADKINSITVSGVPLKLHMLEMRYSYCDAVASGCCKLISPLNMIYAFMSIEKTKSFLENVLPSCYDNSSDLVVNVGEYLRDMVSCKSCNAYTSYIFMLLNRLKGKWPKHDITMELYQTILKNQFISGSKTDHHAKYIVHDGGFCVGCLEQGYYTCGGCLVDIYCCKECQQDEWPEHRLKCKLNNKFNRKLIEFQFDIIEKYVYAVLKDKITLDPIEILYTSEEMEERTEDGIEYGITWDHFINTNNEEYYAIMFEFLQIDKKSVLNNGNSTASNILKS